MNHIENNERMRNEWKSNGAEGATEKHVVHEMRSRKIFLKGQRNEIFIFMYRAQEKLEMRGY